MGDGGTPEGEGKQAMVSRSLYLYLEQSREVFNFQDNLVCNTRQFRMTEGGRHCGG